MLFRVAFEASNNAPVARVEGGLAGTKYVNELLGRGVEIDKISSLILTLGCSKCEIEVPFAVALELDAFHDEGRVCVTVPELGLNRFVKVEAVEENGKWHFEYRVDNDALLASWIAAGCPVRWDPSRE